MNDNTKSVLKTTGIAAAFTLSFMFLVKGIMEV